MTGALRRARETYTSAWRALVAVAGLGMVSTIAEAGVLVLLVTLAQNLDAPGTDIELWGLRIGELGAVLAAVGGALVFIGARSAAAAVQAQAQTSWETRAREQLTDAYSGAAPTVQQTSRDSRLVDLTTRFVDQAGNGLVNLAAGLRAALSALMLVIAALLVDPASALVMASVSVFLVLLLRPLTRRVRSAAAATAAAGLSSSDQVAELAATASDARLFDVEGHFREVAGAAAEDYARARRRSQTLVAVSPVLYQGFGLLLAAAAVGLAITATGIELREFGVVALLLLRTLSYGQSVQSTHQRLVAAIPALDEMDAAQAAWRRGVPSEGRSVLERVTLVEVSNVGYAYGDDGPALAHVTLSFGAGDSVALIGPSGAGKSTLAQLLIRYLRPTAGAVLVNALPADSYSRASWSRQVAYVPQQPVLIHGTVRDNIGFHRPHVDDREVREAARLAGLDRTIDALPAGYDTLLGPSERVLSGGQIQRIGIARALAGRPSFLVLDEPTSALDADSETVVVDTLRRLPADIVVVVIAHRLSTVDHCSKVLVLVDGRVETWADHAHARVTSDFYRRALTS